MTGRPKVALILMTQITRLSASLDPLDRLMNSDPGL